jgi:hypothetical protein
MNQTYELPANLGDLMGAYDEAHWLTETREIKPAIGVVNRGTVLCEGAGADLGKLVLTAVGNEAAAYGVLLDPEIDTAVTFGDGTVTGSVARAGSFRGAALIVSIGINVVTLTAALREKGIFTEGAIVAPVATALQSEPDPSNPNPAQTTGPTTEP